MYINLSYFHPRRLKDIQGVVSLWSLGLWRDEQVREHFLDGRSYGGLLSPEIKDVIIIINNTTYII